MKTLKFTEKAIKQHKTRYDYSLIKDIKTMDQKVPILCKIHDKFEQSARAHYNGQGCPKCALLKQKYLQRTKGYITFKQRMYEIYKGKYSLVGVYFKKNTDKINLVCPIHGEFSTTPSVLTNSNRSCLKCSGTYHDGQDTFINKAKEVHGNKYNYSEVNYINNKVKVNIICKKHGVFKQTPADHTSGKGCNKCGNNVQSQKEIIERFTAVHGDRYNYSKVHFKTMHDKVEIICPKHGSFFMKPADHIFNMQGCSGCSTTGFNSTKSAYFYVLKVYNKSKIFYKVGITNKTLKQRYSSTHDKQRIKQCFLYKFSKGGYAKQLESSLISKFKNHLVNEQILLSGNTEILSFDIRKTKIFKELFNEFKRKDSHNNGGDISSNITEN